MIGDTIFAVASPPGPAARGILRLSGPEAFAAADTVLVTPLRRERGSVESAVRVLGHEVPCLVLAMPGPRSYTGEDTVELHLPGSPVLLDAVAEGCTVARAATPGEFTRRAFENGRLDLSAAEAVLALIHAEDGAASRFAVDVLRGGLAAAVEDVRAGIQDALAVLESGLDFTEGETGAVDVALWLPHVQAAQRRCAALRDGLPETAVGGELLLLGMANAGKSSLANALAGQSLGLVADRPGTTRDVLSVPLPCGVTLLDGPGDLDAPTGADAQALALRDALGERVAGVVLVVDATAPVWPATDLPIVAVVVTKCDLAALDRAPDDGPPTFHVSSRMGDGLAGLESFLAALPPSAPSSLTVRLKGHLDEAAQALTAALDAAAAGTMEELVAVDLQAALQHLDAIAGRSSPEDLLDRIFAAFCLGK